MARKRKASSKEFLHHEERSSKRREMPSVSGGNATSEHSNPSVVEMSTTEQNVEASTPEQSAESTDAPLCPIEFLIGPPDAGKAIKIFDYLIAYYQRQTT